MDIRFVDSFTQLDLSFWQQHQHALSPFSQPLFYQLLEQSQSVSTKCGWQPYHLQLSEYNKTKAILPLYLKQHSWGEYVFDWSWSQAYQAYQLPYYPKLVATVPFTPVTTEKFVTDDISLNEILTILSTHCHSHHINSWHLLFCHPQAEITQADVFHRHSVQFHWNNQGYHNFDDLLDKFNSRKRKATRKERRSIIEQGITIKQLTANGITNKELEFCYLCYQLTYIKRGHSSHLTFEFFQAIFSQMKNNILLVIASHRNEYVACALFFYDESQLYGRYWGCTQKFNYLHFELCYYQGIEFCIDNKLRKFNPGTQGEHKIQRGFEPVICHSYHWLKHQELRTPIASFCQQERRQLAHYVKQCQAALPFKQTTNH
ncbi:hypothetical protein tinsulaeT_03040 [Thalassotalea insulae]|uniref:GNAT family N-acetyltransferase n=1 Tax=Thalassotalea insulae TaxID=2056778 RepID=A0ABQ6GMZ0_9GAMM|nr:GNAT family N-acetyltransferase [Thalassotalea insulae]GLX76964.1 hypothetical protein tinsulaeT_03040 [Thalassotalea insulae]